MAPNGYNVFFWRLFIIIKNLIILSLFVSSYMYVPYIILMISNKIKYAYEHNYYRNRILEIRIYHFELYITFFKVRRQFWWVAFAESAILNYFDKICKDKWFFHAQLGIIQTEIFNITLMYCFWGPHLTELHRLNYHRTL